MNKTLVWDIPSRLFHWGFAGSIMASFAIALLVDDDNPLFQLHMLLGLVAVFLLAVRLVLGVVGSRHARFASFPLRPVEVALYFAGVVSGKARTYAGNNPGSALAAVAMFLLVPAIVLTGIGPGGEALEDLHEVLAYTLLGVIGAHLLGIVLHTVRHRENIAASMLTGRKDVPPGEGIQTSHPLWGGALLAASAAWIVALFAGHDARAASVRLPLVGTVVQLGENETGEDDHGGARGEHDDDDDD